MLNISCENKLNNHLFFIDSVTAVSDSSLLSEDKHSLWMIIRLTFAQNTVVNIQWLPQKPSVMCIDSRDWTRADDECVYDDN